MMRIKMGSENPYLYGTVVERNPYSKRGASEYLVEGEDGNKYFLHYSDILTEGFRTLSLGDDVRFIPQKDNKNKLHAIYAIKISDYGEELFYKN